MKLPRLPCITRCCPAVPEVVLWSWKGIQRSPLLQVSDIPKLFETRRSFWKFLGVNFTTSESFPDVWNTYWKCWGRLEWTGRCVTNFVFKSGSSPDFKTSEKCPDESLKLPTRSSHSEFVQNHLKPSRTHFEVVLNHLRSSLSQLEVETGVFKAKNTQNKMVVL